MLRIGLLVLLITGIFVGFKLITKQQKTVFVYYKITSIKAAHVNPDKVMAGEDYYLVLQLNQDIQRHKKRPSLSF